MLSDLNFPANVLYNSTFSHFPRWVWFSTAGRWSQPSQVIRTWPGKLPPMPGWWWWREGTRLTSNWRGGTWWEGGSTPLSPGFWCSPCRLGWGRMGDHVLVVVKGMEGRAGYKNKDCFGASDIWQKGGSINGLFHAEVRNDIKLLWYIFIRWMGEFTLYQIILNVISISTAPLWLTVVWLL